MQNKLCLTILIILSIVNFAYADCYVRYDLGTKQVTEKWYSVDGVVIGIEGRADVITITADQYKSLSKYSVVIDGKLTEMSADDKAALDSKEAAEKAAADTKAAKIPTLEKLLTVLVDKKIITLKDVQDAVPITLE